VYWLTNGTVNHLVNTQITDSITIASDEHQDILDKIDEFNDEMRESVKQTSLSSYTNQVIAYPHLDEAIFISSEEHQEILDELERHGRSDKTYPQETEFNNEIEESIYFQLAYAPTRGDPTTHDISDAITISSEEHDDILDELDIK